MCPTLPAGHITGLPAGGAPSNLIHDFGGVLLGPASHAIWSCSQLLIDYLVDQPDVVVGDLPYIPTPPP